MPRTQRSSRTDTQTSGRRRRSSRSTAEPIVDQITRLVTENESLQLEVARLRTDNEHLRGQLNEIGSALGRLGGRRGRRGPIAAPTGTAAPRRRRRPITDPELLEKRRQALVRARAARAERLAAARAAAAQPAPVNE
jgi:hypothetical protein